MCSCCCILAPAGDISTRLCCAVVGPWILSRNYKSESLSPGDAIQASGKAEKFDALVKNYKILAVHNVVNNAWRMTREEREEKKLNRQLAAQERDERRSTNPRLRALDNRAANRARPSSTPRVSDTRFAKGKGKAKTKGKYK